MEYSAAIYVRCSSASQCERLVFYLDAETRPSFPEDVPASEADRVEAFEFLPVPTDLHRPSSASLLAYFDEGVDSFGDIEGIMGAIALAEPAALYLYFADDEETQHYYRHAEGELEFLYSEVPLDDGDEEYNRRLDEKLRKELDTFDDPGKGLVFLAASLDR